MKIRRFYPRQVLRGMEGRDYTSLSPAGHHAFRYFLRRSRKLGQMIAVLATPDPAALASATEAQQHAVLANCNNTIFLKMPPHANGHPA